MLSGKLNFSLATEPSPVFLARTLQHFEARAESLQELIPCCQCLVWGKDKVRIPPDYKLIVSSAVKSTQNRCKFLRNTFYTKSILSTDEFAWYKKIYI